MNVIECIEAHKNCPLSLFLAYCEDMLRREPSDLGKAYWLAVLEFVE